MSVPTRVFRPAGRHMHRTTHTHGITGEIDSCWDFGGSLNYRKYSENGKSLPVIISPLHGSLVYQAPFFALPAITLV